MSATRVAAKRTTRMPEIMPGDTVKVSVRIVEGDKERIQPFQGVVIKIRGGGVGASFTVRRVAYGVGIERTFLLQSPMVEKVEVIRHGKVRRARLYYLRGLSGKASRIKERRMAGKIEEVPPELISEPEPEAEMVPVAEQPEAEAAQPEVAPVAEPLKAEKAPESGAAQTEPAKDTKPAGNKS